MQRINALEKECASLADRLIQGQVTRAQEAEEMFIVKKELSRLKRKVSAIEEEQTKLESEKSEVQINGTIVEEEQNEEGAQGEGEGPVTDRQEDDEKIERQQLIVMAPIHVCREEAEQVLRELGVRTPGTSPRISTAEGPQSSFPEAPKQAKKISIPDSPESSPPLSLKLTLKQEKKEHRKHKRSKDSTSGNSSPSEHEMDQLMRELALAKTQCAEVSGQVEQKKMELRRALQREALAVRELHSAKQYIATLEQRLSEVQMEKLQCPHCSQQLGKQESSYASGPADPNSSEVLFSHLRAMWNSQITTTNGDPRTRIEQFSQYESNWT